MKQLTIDDLRALIRLIPAARALQAELEKTLHLETYDSVGGLAVRSFTGLQASVYGITEDPYVAALAIDADSGLSDRQRVSQAILAAGQLIAYLEGQTGVAGLTGKQSTHVQTAPTITLNMDGFHGGPIETERIMETVDRALRYRPPVPPAPPTPVVPPLPPAPQMPVVPPVPPAPPAPPVRPDWLGRHDEDDH
jgi:hypothetical protein